MLVKIKNRRGFMRVVESTIAVLIVLGVLILLSSQRKTLQEQNPFPEIPIVLDEIAQNVTLRIEVLSTADEATIEEKLNNFALKRIDSGIYNSAVEICEVEEPCFLEPFPETDSEVIAEERIVGASIREQNFSPKKIKIFIWKKI